MNRIICPSCLAEIAQYGLEAFLEFTAELGAGNQCAHVERQDALAAQPFRYFVVDDALREPLDDRGLADAGFADQYRVVLGAPLQDLDRAADFVIAADDRIELALLGTLGQVDRVFFERLPGVFCIRVVDLLTAAKIINRLSRWRLARPRPVP